MAEIAETRPIVAYAQPLSRLQVSWGAILAGAFSFLATIAILWSLALAIVLTATDLTIGDLTGSLIALWIVGIAVVFIGAFVAGIVAGYLPGNPRRSVTLAHSFLAWCVAFVAATVLELIFVGGIARSAVNTAATTASAAVQTVGSVAGGAVTGRGALAERTENMLVSLGYTPAEANSLVTQWQTDIQRTLRGNVEVGAPGARGALNTVVNYLALVAWLWWGSWFLAAGIAVLGGLAVMRSVRKVPEKEHVPEVVVTRPIEPAPGPV